MNYSETTHEENAFPLKKPVVAVAAYKATNTRLSLMRSDCKQELLPSFKSRIQFALF